MKSLSKNMDYISLVLDFLEKHYPQVLTYAIVIVLVAFLVYKTTKFYIETKIDCGEIPDIKKLLTKIDGCLNILNKLLLLLF